ncbi:MAG TPA: peptidylprolyl isomerase [Actinomycetota bacterium]|nr:peptidylprolyl isomerase [Actinomycetota bacterium]
MPRPRVLALAFGAVLVVTASACGRPPAAVVGGARISDAQLAHDVRLFRFLAELNGSACGQPVEGEPAGSACARFTLQNLIQEEVAKAYARERGISVPQARVEDTVSRLEAALGGPEALAGRLRSAGLTPADLRELVRRLLLFEEVRRAVVREVVTDAELRRAYEERRTAFTTLHAAHILVATRREALQLAARTTPANFAANARHFSTDRASARNGGDLGEIPADQFDPRFVEAALALRPGEISAPVRTRFGWHLIRLISVDVVPFEEVRERLLEEEAGPAFDRWMRERLRATTVLVNPRFGTFDVASGLVLPIRSTSTSSPAAGAPVP